MKRIVTLIALILAPALSFAQTNAQQNEAGTTYLPNAGNISSNIAVDRALRQIITLSAGTASVNNPVKNEDTAQTSGDAGIPALVVRNEGGVTIADANLDYSFLGANRFGALFVEISSDKQFAGNSTGLLKPEDSVPGSGDAGIVPLVRGIGTGSLAPSAGTSGDYEWQNNDSDGRLFVNPYGANPGQWFQTCGTATATTEDVAIKSAAGASTRNYITGITCSNSSDTTATNINFKDGSTVIAVGGVNQMATTSSGAFTATFPVPLRGTANKAFNFNTAVSVSSVVCCAVGYTSANS